MRVDVNKVLDGVSLHAGTAWRIAIAYLIIDGFFEIPLDQYLRMRNLIETAPPSETVYVSLGMLIAVAIWMLVPEILETCLVLFLRAILAVLNLYKRVHHRS